MNITIGLARVCGFICLLIGFSVLNKKSMLAIINEIEHNFALLWFMGFIAAILGSVVLSLYSTWSASLAVLITIFGWMALIKGIALMLFPVQSWHSFYRKFKYGNVVLVSGFISIIFGILLLYKGFIK